MTFIGKNDIISPKADTYQQRMPQMLPADVFWLPPTVQAGAMLASLKKEITKNCK